MISNKDKRNKKLKTQLNLIAWLSWALVILTSWANVYEYSVQVYITIMFNEFILLAFAARFQFLYLKAFKENFELKCLAFDANNALSAQSLVVVKQLIEIKKLKKVINGQANNVDSV